MYPGITKYKMQQIFGESILICDSDAQFRPMCDSDSRLSQMSDSDSDSSKKINGIILESIPIPESCITEFAMCMLTDGACKMC